MSIMANIKTVCPWRPILHVRSSGNPRNHLEINFNETREGGMEFIISNGEIGSIAVKVPHNDIPSLRRAIMEVSQSDEPEEVPCHEE